MPLALLVHSAAQVVPVSKVSFVKAVPPALLGHSAMLVVPASYVSCLKVMPWIIVIPRFLKLEPRDSVCKFVSVSFFAGSLDPWIPLV